MINILNSEESIAVDIITLQNKSISNNMLIDNAGKAISFHIIEKIKDPFNKRFLCVAGIGNNGLDSIVCNYYLTLNNIKSDLLFK